MSQNEFCEINNAEIAPEISNEFVAIYLENRKHTAIERSDATDYTRHFCHWLFINGYTCSKLSMVA